jgi:hypothetical protein
VREGCGVKVPLGSRAGVIAGLAAAIRAYDQDRRLVHDQGCRAREAILQHYDWDKKGEQMNEVYEKAVAVAPVTRADRAGQRPYTGLGSTAPILSRLLSFRGLMVGLFTLLLVGTLGFMSLSFLKRQAAQIVTDTLPGLSYAGEANTYLADGYRTLMFVVADDAERRAELRTQMHTLAQRTSYYLSKYSTQMNSEEDRTNFVALVHARREFVQVRDKVMALASEGKRDEALALFHQSLIPIQAKVKTAGQRLLEFNMREGQSRGHAITVVCTTTQIIVAGIVIVIFLLGFFIGLSR